MAIAQETLETRYETWAEEVRELARDRDAVILAHNYQVPWIQDVADFVGDSLELSRKAAASDAREIAFCGVHFMAETAGILCPDKRVLLQRTADRLVDVVGQSGHDAQASAAPDSISRDRASWIRSTARRPRGLGCFSHSR